MSIINAWAEFIDARILQEKAVLGDKKADEQALTILERLCAAYPQNPSFLKAKAWSLSIQNREPEAAASVIEAAYGALAQRLSGEHDVAKDWITELDKLKTTLSSVERTKITAGFACW